MHFTGVEVGPHFLTFYCQDLKQMNRYLPSLWKVFVKEYPDMLDINHENFIHWAGDPAVYHRFGQPNHFREDYRHFHINTESRPSTEMVTDFIAFIARNGGTFDEIIKVTIYENYKLEEHKNDTYPERQSGEEYLDYLDRLKNG